MTIVSAAPSPALLRQAVAHLAPVIALLTELGEVFRAAGHELALVGGPVRDAFLGRESPDLDFTTSAGRGGVRPSSRSRPSVLTPTTG